MTVTISRMRKVRKKALHELFERIGETGIVPNPDFFADNRNIFLVAYADGILSGFLWAYVLDRPHSMRPEMLLYSIDVFEEFRRRGVATLLIERLKVLAVKNNCSEMFVPTRKSNAAAVGLYRKTGGKTEADDDVSFIYGQDALVLEGSGGQRRGAKRPSSGSVGEPR